MTHLLITPLSLQTLPTAQADADMVRDEAKKVLVQVENDLLTSRMLRKRADDLATLTQNQLLVLECMYLVCHIIMYSDV